MRRLHQILIIIGLTLLAACAPIQTKESELFAIASGLPNRPAGTPDVALFVVSGRCALPCNDAPDANWNYLEPRGTVAQLASDFSDLGLSVQTRAYSAHPLAEHRSRLSGQTELGFEQLLRDVDAQVAASVRGYANPTRIVLVGHSHGVNWTHNLAKLRPAVPITLSIDFDGVCFLWESENRALLRGLYAQSDRSFWPRDISRSCASERTLRGRVDVKDLVFSNVRHNLEIQSKRPAGDAPNFPFDLIRNVRADGSYAGIETFVSAAENHSNVTRPGSAALAWVRERVQGLWRAGQL